MKNDIRLTEKLLKILLPTINQDHHKIARQENKDYLEVGTQLEQYAKIVHYSLERIKSGIKDLNEVTIYVSIDTYPSEFLSKGIDEKEYYKHQYQNFYIRFIFVIDYIWHLINNAAKLSIKSYNVKESTILKNKRLKGTELLKNLTNFAKEFKNLKDLRNKLVHHGIFKDERLNALEAFILPNIYDVPELSYSADFLKYNDEIKNEKVESINSYMRENIEKLERSLEDILYHINIIFDTQIELLSK